MESEQGKRSSIRGRESERPCALFTVSYPHTHTHTSNRHIYTYTCMHTHTYKHTHPHSHTHTHKQQAHTHTHTHTHTQDLGARDVQSSSVFLVCQIVRKGKMLLDDKKNVSAHPFRRPYACGILEVTSVLQFQEEGEMTSFQNEDLTTYNVPLYLR